MNMIANFLFTFCMNSCIIIITIINSTNNVSVAILVQSRCFARELRSCYMEEEIPPLGPVQLGAAEPSGRSGGAKRKRRNELPQCFLLLSPEGYVYAAALIVRICLVNSTGRLIALLGGLVLLEQAQAIASGDKAHRGAVFRLTPDFETRCRTQPARGGGTVNSHFIAHAASVWRCWPISREQKTQLNGHMLAPRMEIENKYVVAIGVTPEIVADYSEVFPEIGEDVGSGEAVPLASAPQQPEAAAGPSSSAELPLGSPQQITAAVLERLHGHANLREGGMVTHTYSPEIMLRSLIFKHHVKASYTLQQVLAAAAPFFFPIESSSEIASELLAGNVSLPSPTLLRDAMVRLDLINLLWRRVQWDENNYWLYLNPDASPQLGWE